MEAAITAADARDAPAPDGPPERASEQGQDAAQVPDEPREPALPQVLDVPVARDVLPAEDEEQPQVAQQVQPEQDERQMQLRQDEPLE